MHTRLLVACLIGPALAGAQPKDAADSIRAEIVRGAVAFERGDGATIIDHYARDVVLSYPGEADMDYATLAAGYAALRDRPTGVTARTVPTFDEVLLSGDLAVVRLRWVTTIGDSTGRSVTRRLKDLQVWRREPTGRWMFVRGMHYREPPDSTPAAALVARAIERAGGAASLEKAGALAWDGEAVVHAAGRDVRIAGQWRVQPPDSGVIATYDVTRGPSSTRSLVVAAPRGWIVAGGDHVAMPAELLSNERDALYLYDVIRLRSLRDPAVALTRVDPDSLGQPGVRARRAGRPDVDLFFDVATGRLAHVRMTIRHDGRPTRQDAWLSGEAAADGVRWFRDLRLTLDGAPYFDITVHTLRLLPRLGDPRLAGPPGSR